MERQQEIRGREAPPSGWPSVLRSPIRSPESSPARGGETEPPLLAVLVACALGLVTSQHKGRRAFSQLEREQAVARELEADYGRLQLEASTWGLHSRVEKLATRSLGLRAADPRRVRLVGRDPGR